MKNNRHNYFTLAVAFLMLPIFAACRTEICYDHYPVAEISLSWEKEWERDYGMEHNNNWADYNYGIDYKELYPETPEWVTMHKFSDDGSTSEHYLSPDGGEVIVNAGAKHSLLLYNSDTEYIILSDVASLSDARASATTRTRSPLAYIMERHPGLRSTNPPDILYSAFIEEVPKIDIHQRKQMPIKMQPLVFTYLIRFEFEEGLQKVNLARGALAGMAGSVYLRDGKTSDESTIILYDCEITDYGCVAKVKSFGIPGFPDKYYGRADTEENTTPQQFTLNLELLLKNGKTKEFNYDIDDQMQNQPRGGVITIKGIKIEDDEPDDNKESGGWQVNLNGWGNTVNVDLEVGKE